MSRPVKRTHASKRKGSPAWAFHVKPPELRKDPEAVRAEKDRAIAEFQERRGMQHAGEAADRVVARAGRKAGTLQ